MFDCRWLDWRGECGLGYGHVLKREKRRSLLAACALFGAWGVQAEEGATSPKGGGWYILHWVEQADANGALKEAKPEDRTEFKYAHSFDRKAGDAGFTEAKKQLREGDVIAYRLDKWARVDASRLHEFVKLSQQAAGRFLRRGDLPQQNRAPLACCKVAGV